VKGGGEEEAGKALEKDPMNRMGKPWKELPAVSPVKPEDVSLFGSARPG